MFTPFSTVVAELAQEQLRGDQIWVNSVFPVYSSLLKLKQNVVGFLVMSVSLETLFDNLLPQKVRKILVIIKNTCGQSIAYEIENGKVCWQICLNGS